MVQTSVIECGLAAAGGALIGIATSLNLALAGKITGISGLFGGLL